jgi:hypothetical protein
MTNHRKHRRTRRKGQKGGGLLYNWFGIDWFDSPETSSEPIYNNVQTQPEPGIIEKFDNALGTAGEAVTGAISSTANAATNLVSPTQQPMYNTGVGGRRRRNASRNLRGGKGGLGLTYYATEVSGFKVAEPTTWLKGGSRRRRRSRKVRR